jgi:signal transduction histidine kinase
VLSYLNPAGRAMLGLDAEAGISAFTVFDLHTESARKNMKQVAIPAALMAGNWMGRSVLRSRDGAEIDTSQVIIAHYGQDGMHEGFSIVEHDMRAWLEGEQALRDSNAELARLSAQLISVQETERRRIAADIHDGIGQSLSLIRMRVATAVGQLEIGDAAAALATLNGLLPQVKDAIGEVRRVATDLHPSSLEDLGILPTLSWFFREIETACQGVRVEREFVVSEADIHPSLRIVIFRIIQEAVSNILKHATPRRIRVRLQRRRDALQLRIEDDGCGFDPASIAGIDCAGRGFGLSSMKERARFSGASYQLRSAIGQGTRIEVEWPTPALVGGR